MRILLFEYVTGGGWNEPELPTSLANEGWSMWRAVLEDLVAESGLRVLTLLDQRLALANSFPALAQVDVLVVERAGPKELAERLAAVARTCDAAFFIAPETDGVLATLCRQMIGLIPTWNASPAAIERCGDKWQTFQLWQAAEIPTIPTRLLSHIDAADYPVDHGPQVVKPRDGAGSVGLKTVSTRAAWDAFRQRICQTGTEDRWLVQPLHVGQPLSVAALFDNGHLCELFPIAEQQLSADGRFTYQGGCVPARHTATVILPLIVSISQLLPGLHGYIGFDLLANESGWQFVEINPRLTSSYLGYRQLVNSPPRYLLRPGSSPLQWKSEQIVFTPTRVE